MNTILVASRGMQRIPFIDVFLHAKTQLMSSHNAQLATCVAGWGRRPSFYTAQKYAEQHDLTLITLEDGFIRSMGLGVQGAQPLSLIRDDVGVYFDAHQPSRLEQLITQGHDQTTRAKQAIQTIVDAELSKYNQISTTVLDFAEDQQHVLIVDQTVGDQSIRLAGAEHATFERMLMQALKKHPHAQIWIKTHPDVLSGKKQGHFDAKVAAANNIHFISTACNPIALLKKVQNVYVVSSHMGFEALMLGKAVHCFGVPWYAGWGLTDDQHAPLSVLSSRRGISRTLTQLFSAAYFDYALYVDPVMGQRCELEQVVQLLVQQKYWNEQLQGRVLALGFSRWKRKFIRAFLQQRANQVQFKWFYPHKAEPNTQYVFWGNKRASKRIKLQENATPQIWRMEDGFIRSNGLGANLIAPLSLVLDDQGVYYDATQPSRLEHILNHIQLTEAQQQRALQLQHIVVSQKISKYNVGQQEAWPEPPDGKEVILVPGQVEDDASVQLGGEGIFSNFELLQAVRRNKPNAWIVFKPHPDVEAGLRPGKLSLEQVSQCADAIIYHLDMPSCLERVDAVHTLTSLTGFEALLRGKGVWCYGMPFYAGWGLTVDRTQCLRRARQLSLAELIHGVLIDYPLYKLPHSGEYLATPEQACDYLVNERHPTLQNKLSLVARLRALIIYGQ